MYRLLFYIGLILICGCEFALKKEDLKQLNGYWEIVKVEFENGEKKEYTINTTIDFIETDGNNGFHKKVQPHLNGLFSTSDDAETFEILEKNGVFHLVYEKRLHQRKEQLLTLTDNAFSVQNEEKTTYHYKKYEPILQQD